MPVPEPRSQQPAWREFESDCSSCAGLCCTALPYARSREFAADKPAGRPCVHLHVRPGAGLPCRIHDRLRTSGWVGCTVFECFGAGQRVMTMFGGRPWTHEDVDAPTQFAAFEAMRIVQEVRYYCRVLADHKVDGQLRTALAGLEADALEATQSPARSTADAARALRNRARPVLRAASEQLRHRRSGSAVRRSGRTRLVAGADLAGADLRGKDLSRLDLCGALLIGADLRGARLELTDVLGADLRDTDVRGAGLRTALFLSQAQVNAAYGDAATRLPPHLHRPKHWTRRAG